MRALKTALDGPLSPAETTQGEGGEGRPARVVNATFAMLGETSPVRRYQADRALFGCVGSRVSLGGRASGRSQ